jgi:hypothetical protein
VIAGIIAEPLPPPVIGITGVVVFGIPWLLWRGV